MTNDAAREAFERFHGARKAKGVGRRERMFERLPDDTYADPSVQRHWWTWQNARAALSEQPAPTQPAAKCHWDECPHGADCVHAAQPARVVMSDEQIDKIFAAHLNGFVTAQDHRNAARAVIAEYERLSGITPSQGKGEQG